MQVGDITKFIDTDGNAHFGVIAEIGIYTYVKYSEFETVPYDYEDFGDPNELGGTTINLAKASDVAKLRKNDKLAELRNILEYDVLEQ